MRAAPETLLLRLCGGLATKSLIGAASMLALSSEVTVCSELSSPYLGFPLKEVVDLSYWKMLINLVNFQ